jgi:hypothetical protein
MAYFSILNRKMSPNFTQRDREGGGGVKSAKVSHIILMAPKIFTHLTKFGAIVVSQAGSNYSTGIKGVPTFDTGPIVTL